MIKVNLANSSNTATIYTAKETDALLSTVDGGTTTTVDYNDLINKPIIPTQTSQLTNNSNFISDASYVHTDNNYTTTEKTKLSGIEANANNYIHPASHPPSIITQDASNRFVTDTEKATWNSKADGSHNHTGVYQPVGSYATSTDLTTHTGNTTAHITSTERTTWNGKQDALSGDVTTHYHTADRYTHPATHSADIIIDGTTNKAYTSTEKTKLAGIATNANNYTHPSTHSADIIVDGITNKAYTTADHDKLAGLSTVATSGSYTDLINKPTIPTALSQLTEDSTHRTVTDAEKSAWNSASGTTATTNLQRVLSMGGIL